MNLKILHAFLSLKITENPRFLFLKDESQILTDLTELEINEAVYQVIYYENDLQLRAELEWAKDETGDIHFCIISRHPEAMELYILDFIKRSQVIVVTPQVLLNFAGNEHWSEAANWLRGHDFWRCLETLCRIRNLPHLSMLDSNQTCLASALLEIDLTRQFDPAAGFLFYFRKMDSRKYKNFQQSYPQLAKFVKNKLFFDVPEIKEFSQSPQFLQDFWLSRYDQISTEMNQVDKAADLKYQIAVKAPHFVQDQIESIENQYFRQPDQLADFLSEKLLTDSWEGWLDYIRQENYLTRPLKQVITKVLEYLVRKHEFVDLPELLQVSRVFDEHQLVRASQNLPDRTQPELVHFFKLFRNVVQLYFHYRQATQLLAGPAFEIQSMIQHVYPNHLSKMPSLLETIETINQRHHFLSESLVKKISQDVTKLQAKIHADFTGWVETRYKFPPTALTEQTGAMKYPFQWLGEYLKQTPPIPVFVLVFDGMRWDGWEALQPNFTQLFHNYEFMINPILQPIPTLTELCRSFLLGGAKPPIHNHASIQEKFNLADIDFLMHQPGKNVSVNLKSWLDSTSPVKVVNFDLFDRRIHHSKLSLKMLYREVIAEFEQDIIPVLEQIPQDAVILLCADHGFIQVTGKWFGNLKYDQQTELPVQHRRFIPMQAVDADRKHFLFFSNDKLGRKEETGPGLAFLRTPKVFKLHPAESFTRYAHGGISLEEMVVPMVVFQPERRRND